MQGSREHTLHHIRTSISRRMSELNAMSFEHGLHGGPGNTYVRECNAALRSFLMSGKREVLPIDCRHTRFWRVETRQLVQCRGSTLSQSGPLEISLVRSKQDARFLPDWKRSSDPVCLYHRLDPIVSNTFSATSISLYQQATIDHNVRTNTWWDAWWSGRV